MRRYAPMTPRNHKSHLSVYILTVIPKQSTHFTQNV